MSLVLIHSDRFLEHQTPPGHPERVERGEVTKGIAASWAERGGTVLAPRPATREELARVHSDEHLAAIDDTAGCTSQLDPDTYTSPASRDVARLAAGAAIIGVETVARSATNRAMALVRPPGHHAERDRAMGFCLYNNVAAAAAQAIEMGMKRVVIVDYDVHHGNGTQWIFYDDPRVLYVSTHQYPFYPGTGAAAETGRGAGLGFTLNVPLEAGANDADYQLVFEALVVPVIDQYRPELVLVSAGFDAHEDDPLAEMRMSAEGYACLTKSLCDIADTHCAGRLVAVTEGGYDLAALKACLESTVEVLAGTSTPERAIAPTPRARNTIAAVRAVHDRYWKL